jgi:hypothetical protein
MQGKMVVKKHFAMEIVKFLAICLQVIREAVYLQPSKQNHCSADMNNVSMLHHHHHAHSGYTTHLVG